MSIMPTNIKKTEPTTVFGRPNRVIILLACVAIVAGLVLMAGDGTTEASFESGIFSTRRTVVAPMVCLAGYLAIIAGILLKTPASCHPTGQSQKKRTKNRIF